MAKVEAASDAFNLPLLERADSFGNNARSGRATGVFVSVVRACGCLNSQALRRSIPPAL